MSTEKLDQLLLEFTTFRKEVATAFSGMEDKFKVQQAAIETLKVDSSNSTVPADNGQHAQHVQQPVRTENGQSSNQFLTSLGGSTSRFAQVDTEPLQARFRTVRDSVSSCHLSDDLYFSGRQFGVDKTVKEAAGILTSTAKYVEMALKLTGSLQEDYFADPLMRDKLDDLMVTLVACMRNLQEKQAGLVVAGTYGAKAKRMYDSLSSANSNFGHPQILQRVEQAAKLVSLVKDEPNPFHQCGNNCGRFQGSWRGCSSFRGCGHGGHQEFTPGFSSLPVPTERDDSQ